LADTADITNPRSEATGRADVRQDTQKFAEAAIADSKRQGLLLAVRARWVALAVTAVTLPIINPNWDVVYYVLMLIPFAVIGWAQLKVGKAGRSRPELFLMFCDLALLTFLAIVPNPLNANWPAGMQFRFNTSVISLSSWPPPRWPIHGERWSRWASGPQACGPLGLPGFTCSPRPTRR
jgi:adenylate cyclase